MNYKKLPIQSLIIWEIVWFISSGVIFFILWNFFKTKNIIAWILLLMILVVWMVMAMGYLPLLYFRIQYTMTKHQFILKSGVLTEKISVMIYKNISFITLYRLPFNQFLPLSGIVLCAPGAKLLLFFISRKSADEIMHRTLQQMKHHQKKL